VAKCVLFSAVHDPAFDSRMGDMIRVLNAARPGVSLLKKTEVVLKI
jgi:hypothetical protein